MIRKWPKATDTGRIVRLAEQGRSPIRFRLNGIEYEALSGDTVLTAILLWEKALRLSEFSPESRAGFCLMGTCQDCWVWQEDGSRLRACTTFIAEGMGLKTDAPEEWQ